MVPGRHSLEQKAGRTRIPDLFHFLGDPQLRLCGRGRMAAGVVPTEGLRGDRWVEAYVDG